MEALAIRQTPELEPGAVYAHEIATLIAHEVACNEYSASRARAKIHALEELSASSGHPNPTAVTTADVTDLYRRLQARVAGSTAQGYLVTIRSFYNWLLAEKEVRSNPVKDVRMDRVDLKGRDKFCSAALRDKLVAECSRNDLKLTLFARFSRRIAETENRRGTGGLNLRRRTAVDGVPDADFPSQGSRTTYDSPDNDPAHVPGQTEACRAIPAQAGNLLRAPRLSLRFS